MEKTKNSRLTKHSQRLRREMTKEERRLWYDFLKSQPVTVNRQKVIGKYIVDFYCAEAQLIIELDGSQHYNDEGQDGDRERDSYLRELGFTVRRYSNYDVNQNFDGVCRDILQYISPSSVG